MNSASSPGRTACNVNVGKENVINFFLSVLSNFLRVAVKKYIAFTCLFVVLLGIYAVLIHLHFSGRGLNAPEELTLILLIPVFSFVMHQYGYWTGRVSRAFLRKVIDVVPSMLFVKDRYGRFQLANQALADVYGTTVTAIIGKRDEDYNRDAEEVNHFVEDDLEVITRLQDKFIPEEEVTDANGITRWFQTVKRPLRIVPGGDVQVLGVATDITETKRLQHELLQAQKMEAIGQLAGGVAHDFNNLLTAILGHAELLKIHGEHRPEILRSAEAIESAAHQGAQLTQKLLAFARKGKHENVALDLHSVITEARIILGRTMSGDAVIRANLGAYDSQLMGDPVQIEQIVMNLAINARDAIANRWGMDAGRKGEIVIETRTRSRQECMDFEDLPVEGNYFVELTVRDNGCGIPAENHSKVFEPFFTTKEPGKGTGMGLPMVFGIVKSHGGGLCLTSREGEGTTMSILLPVYRGAEASKAA